jgi:hypothetical protein
MAEPSEAIETGNLPTVITAAGLVPTPPIELRNQLTILVSKTNPGYTNNLPGGLIEDIASTDVQALVMMDQARVEALNDLTPYGCNEFVLVLLGKVYGVMIGQPSNTSVFVQFTGLPGFVIGKGFVVGDGNHQYIIEDGGIIGTDGQSPLLYAVASLAGAWAVPAGTVVELVTPPPSGFALSVVNPEPGIPAVSGESATQYRSRVLRAGLAASQGMARYLRTLLTNVAGVQDRLVHVKSQPGGGWMVIVGGGDPYQVAYAIYQALFDISTLVGSTIHITDISHADPAVVTTDLNHGFATGQDVDIEAVTPTVYNGAHAVADVPSEKTFVLGTHYPANQLTALSWAAGIVTADTLLNHGVTVGSTFTLAGSLPDGWNGSFVATAGTATNVLKFALTASPAAATQFGQLQAGIANFNALLLAPYAAGGTVGPNARNITVSITDYPDSYPITFVSPPQQTLIGTTVTWRSSSPNFVSAAAVAQLAGPALATYVNAILVGDPINIMQMEDAFLDAIAPVLPPNYVMSLDFAISINGVGTAPVTGTKIVNGDPQSYFFATEADFTFVEAL